MLFFNQSASARQLITTISRPLSRNAVAVLGELRKTRVHRTRTQTVINRTAAPHTDAKRRRGNHGRRQRRC